MRFVLKLAYHGGNYHGWQRQPNAVTVQELVEAAIEKLLQTKTAVMGCGRTDAGVHADNFILHFDYKQELPELFVFRLNQVLPQDIAVYEAFKVKDNFHSRFDATFRCYSYQTQFVKNPFTYSTSLFLYKKPDIDAMNEACKILLETKDFASFCKSGADNKTTLCDVSRAEWIATENGMTFYVKADRFLRNMVRALVGTLLRVGYGEITQEELAEIIESKNRSAAGKSVSAVGLSLIEIGYNWDEWR